MMIKHRGDGSGDDVGDGDGDDNEDGDDDDNEGDGIWL